MINDNKKCNNLKLFLNLCLTKIILYGNILVDKKKQNKKGVKDYEIRLGDYEIRLGDYRGS